MRPSEQALCRFWRRNAALQELRRAAEADIREMEDDEAVARRALDLLGSCRHDAYEAALASLREDTPRMVARLSGARAGRFGRR
jgi:hypothetical protein